MTSVEDQAPVRAEIVVGVDGSENSRSALLWAANQARLTGARLHAISVWTPDVGATTAWGIPEVPPPDYNPEQVARTELDSFLRDTLGGAESDVASSVRVGPAGRALSEAAEGAELLVLGSHGHSTLRGRLLGSTTTYCIQHATCPVLVLRSPTT